MMLLSYDKRTNHIKLTDFDLIKFKKIVSNILNYVTDIIEGTFYRVK